jgi:hypothetical protein
MSRLDDDLTDALLKVAGGDHGGGCVQPRGCGPGWLLAALMCIQVTNASCPCHTCRRPQGGCMMSSSSGGLMLPSP